jgi:predicted phage baseplate assembly protein
MKIPEICQDKSARRALIRAHTNSEGEPDLNGIDYLEVGEGQRILTVFFLGKAPEEIQKSNIRIEGGTRIRDIRVTHIRLCRIDDPERDDCLKVFVDRPGDYSTYTLRLVNVYGGRQSDEPLDGFDPRYSQIDFSFKANCPTDLDCQAENVCAPEALAEPEINYLAKDYSSFRQLILDRLSLIMPDWRERHVPDLGIALVEVLAYTGDYLSYYQDAVGTEAYLDTARQRISVRRHATLVDYPMHEGCNARVWVCLEVNTTLTGILPQDVYFVTRANSLLPDGGATGSSSAPATRTVLTKEELQEVPSKLYEAFEPLELNTESPLNFYEEHNEIHFYTWRDTECCLPRGATSATLYDDPRAQGGYDYEDQTPPPAKDDDDDYRQNPPPPKYEQKHPQDALQESAEYEADIPAPKPADAKRLLQLSAGDVLIFEEVRGPVTGEPEDVDTLHRHVVRLTKVWPDVDTLTGRLILNIEWAEEDALPFDLCISAVGRAPLCVLIENVSVARGNVVLCDHGRTTWSKPWTVPALDEEDTGCFRVGEPRETALRAGYFRPTLDIQPLTHCVPLMQSSLIARRQSKSLGGLMTGVRALVVQLLKQARRRTALSQAQLDELKAIYTERYLAQVGLIVQAKKEWHVPNAEEQAAALERLLSRSERFLEKKRRRLEVLRRRALSGYVLTKLEHEELSAMFGHNLIEALGLEGDSMLGPASSALKQDPRDAVPCMVVYDSPPASSEDAHSQKKTNEAASKQAAARQPDEWKPERNLLGSSSRDRHFVAEVDDEGRAHLRFGDGDIGRSPGANSILRAKYRVGQGLGGNVGPESIAHLVFREKKTGTPGDVRRVRNPLAARGGRLPERLDEVKLFAPTAFRKVLQRAITSDDYASLASSRNEQGVQRAAASLRWTGSWYEVQVAVDPRGTEELNEPLFEEIGDSLATSRRMGHDLSIKLARYVPLNLALSVCVLPEYLRGHVREALSQLFSNRRLPDGQLGLFHPDNLTFGDSVYVSKLVAAAQSVPGVETVQVTTLERLWEGRNGEIEEGVLPLGPLEVARLDNDPSFPERGNLKLTLRGGR